MLGLRSLSRAAPAALAVLLPVVVATWLGGRGPASIELNLGPGDSPYVHGFTDSYTVVGRERTHWTTYDASVELPLELTGGPVVLSYRYARDFAETADVEVRMGGGTLDRFDARGGAFATRAVELAVVRESPVRVDFLSDSHERRNMGLKLDWVRLDYGEAARVRLRGAAAAAPALTALIVFVAFRLFGWSSAFACLLASPAAVALTAGLASSPWLTHRFLTGIPAASAVYALLAACLGAVLVRRGVVSERSRRIVSTLAFAAFLVRAVAVSHPDFYYPDLRTHATLVETLETAGLDFFRSPSTYIERHNRWVTGAFGRTYAFPYSPAFHLPFALLGLAYDEMLVWMKLVAAAWSTVPLVLVWTLARALALPPFGSALMAVIPTYTSRLSFAFLPSLFGHAVDMVCIAWLAARYDRLHEPRTWIVGTLLVAASQLAYVSGPINLGAFLALFALVELFRREERARRRALGALVMLAGGSVVAFAAFYRDFLPMVADVVRRMTGGVAGAESRYPVRGFLEVAYGRTRDFFDGIHPLLAGLGLARHAGSTLLWAWLFAYLGLLLGRAKVPDLFLHGHETLFVTPLVCLLSGAVLGRWWDAGKALRTLSAGLIAALVAQGLYQQWGAVAAQLLP